MYVSPVLSLLRLGIGIAASSFVEVRGVANAGERPRHHQQHRPQQQRRQLRFLQPVSDDPTSSTLQPQPQRQRRHPDDDITLTLLTECVLYYTDIEWEDDPNADESEEEEEEDWFSPWVCHFTTNTNNNDNPRMIEVIEEEEEETETKHSASIGYVAADILAKHPFIDIVGLSRDVIKSFEQQQQKPIVSGGTILKIMTTTVTANNRNRNRNSDRPSPSRRNDETTNIFDRDVVVATPTATDRINRPRQEQQQNQPNSTKQYQKQEQQQEEMIEVEQQPYLEQLITIDTDATRNPNAIPIEGSLKLVIPPTAVYVLESIPESDPRHYQARHRRRRERQHRDRQLLSEKDKNTEAWYGSFGNTSATPGSKTRHQTRNLLGSMGILEVLVVRVVAGNGVQPPSEAKLQNDIFLDQACLSSQYRACSHGQLNIIPSRYGTKGIATVRIEGRSSNSKIIPSQLADEAITALQRKFGGNFADNIDLLMLCLPPGNYHKGWVRYLLSFYCYYHYYIIHIIVIGNCLCFLLLVFVVSLQIERGKSLSMFGIVFLITFLCTIFCCSFFHFLPSK